MTNHGICTGMEKGNVANNVRQLFPNKKGGCKTDCEVSRTTFFCYKWCQYRGVFLSQLSICDGLFCGINLRLSAVNYFRKKLHLRCESRF